jgi:hypothetical protein
MLERLDKFRSALESLEALRLDYQWSKPLCSAIDQLKYLIDFELKKTTDSSRLRTINIGIIAAREIEDMDILTADKIYVACEEVSKMQAEL